MKAPGLFFRNSQFYIRRRVPVRYACVEPRVWVKICLFTDEPVVANKKAPEIWKQMIEAWEAMLAGESAEGSDRLVAAREVAQKRGFRFLMAADVAKLPTDQLLSRIDAVVDGRGRLNMQVAEAVLGLVDQPQVKVSETVDTFYEVAAERLVGKSKDQLRRHRAPRAKAIRNFQHVIGDKDLADISTEDLFRFKQWWRDRVKTGEVLAASANKDFVYLNAMWGVISKEKSIKLQYSSEGLAFPESKAKARTRAPFSDSWIRGKLLADSALRKMNTDARLILLGMINTGYRPSEGAGLLPDEIILDHDVPHIMIRPNKNRALKNDHSERYIPLTGVSLEALREVRLTAFPRYATSSATLSGTVNKFLLQNKLLQTPAHSLYGLRHAFEDRLLVAGVDERIRRDLMGHGLKRERYGLGGDMAHVHGLMLGVAL